MEWTLSELNNAVRFATREGALLYADREGADEVIEMPELRCETFVVLRAGRPVPDPIRAGNHQ